MDVAPPVPLPHTVRAPVPADVDTVFSVFEAYNTSVVGFADCTLDDVVDNFAEPGFDLATDAWLAHDDRGQPSGYGCVFSGTEGSDHHVEVAAADPSLARWLLDRSVVRSREIARDRRHDEVTIDIGIYRSDRSLSALVADAGFEVGTTFHRLRIDHVGPVVAPDLPPGVTLRTGADGLDVRRAAYEILRDAFADQFGFTPRTFEQWTEVREARPTFRWDQVTVLELDGRPVAVREDTDQFVPDEDCGYVHHLAVTEEDRGRGLAKLLLRLAFASDAAAGRAGTILHVDTNNPTPALDLYQSVGMEAVLVIDVWRTTIPT